MFLLGIKVLHAVFPHFLSVVLVHRSATLLLHALSQGLYGLPVFQILK